MELNGIPLSSNSARLLYVPVAHLMKHTLMACDPNDIENEEYRAIYADGIWSEKKARSAWRPMYHPGLVVARKPIFNMDCV